MQHLDEGTLHAWIDGALPAAEADAVAAHVASCAECAAAAAEARGLIAGASRVIASLDVVPKGVIPAGSSSTPSTRSLWRTLRFTPARAAIAATLLVGVASMLTVRRQERLTQAPVDSLVRVNTAIPPSAAAPSKPVAPASEPSQNAAEHQPAPTERLKTIPRALQAPRNSAGSEAATASNVAASAAAPPPAIVGAAAGAAAGVTAQAAPSAKTATADVARAQRDSIAAQRATAEAASAAPAAVARDRAFSGQALGLAAGAASFEGCYRLLPDSAFKLAGVPAAFVLERDPGGRNVVRSLGPENRPDSVLANAQWRALAPNVASVTIPASRGTSMQLVFAANATTGRATMNAQSADVRVQRTNCRP